MSDLDILLIFRNDGVLLHYRRLNVSVSAFSHSHWFSDLGILNVFVVDRRVSGEDMIVYVVDVVVDGRHFKIVGMSICVRRVNFLRY